MFKSIFIWHLSEKCYYKHTMKITVVWFSFYVYIFAIPTYLTTSTCLPIFFFFKNYMSLERSPLDEPKKNIKPPKI